MGVEQFRMRRCYNISWLRDGATLRRRHLWRTHLVQGSKLSGLWATVWRGFVLGLLCASISNHVFSGMFHRVRECLLSVAPFLCPVQEGTGPSNGNRAEWAMPWRARLHQYRRHGSIEIPSGAPFELNSCSLPRGLHRRKARAVSRLCGLLQPQRTPQMSISMEVDEEHIGSKR